MKLYGLALKAIVIQSLPSYTLPLIKFAIISRAVIRTVLKNEPKSSVENMVSANPKGSIGGIHPMHTYLSGTR
jgi:hypothetical protein